jgi:hypothetical protein
MFSATLELLGLSLVFNVDLREAKLPPRAKALFYAYQVMSFGLFPFGLYVPPLYRI